MLIHMRKKKQNKKNKLCKFLLKLRREEMKEDGFFDGRYTTKTVTPKKHKKPKYKKDLVSDNN